MKAEVEWDKSHFGDDMSYLACIQSTTMVGHVYQSVAVTNPE